MTPKFPGFSPDALALEPGTGVLIDVQARDRQRVRDLPEEQNRE